MEQRGEKGIAKRSGQTCEERRTRIVIEGRSIRERELTG
jgi:hypothetical protein